MEFIKQNIWLVGLAIGSAAMLLWPGLRRSASGVVDLSPTEAVMLINREHPLVLDVRDPAEFAGGHIADARNIPLNELANRLAELDVTPVRILALGTAWAIAMPLLVVIAQRTNPTHKDLA